MIGQTSLKLRMGTDLKFAAYSPFPLYQGGGEFYFLKMIETIQNSLNPAQIELVLLYNVSILKLSQLCKKFNLDLNLDNIRIYDVYEWTPRNIDLFLEMSHSIKPAFGKIAKFSIVHCQFPFPMNRSEMCNSKHEEVDLYLLNSKFSEKHFRNTFSLYSSTQPPVEILYPPVQIYEEVDGVGCKQEKKVVSIGRFSNSGHNKNQNLLIDILEKLLEFDDYTLSLIGSIDPTEGLNSAKKLLERVEKSNLPVTFHFNASQDTKWKELLSSTYFWSGTGLGVNQLFYPQKLEHFGISVVEAMSASCLPLVFNGGGHLETVTHGVSGFHFNSGSELISRHNNLTRDPDLVLKIQNEAKASSKRYSIDIFESSLRAILNNYVLFE